jgi:RNA polymerase sigma-70 factor, ECF subfamily
MGWGHRKNAVSEPSTSELSLAPPAVTPPETVSTPADLVRPSFESVYRAHAKTVSRWAMRLLGHGDVEDVVHDVFLVVKRRLPEFRGDAEMPTWLYEITVRVVQDSRRRARYWSWVTGRGQKPSRGQMQGPFVPIAETPRDPQTLLEARERTRLLYRVLDELGEAHRTAFILFELEGFSGEQIAEITGTQVSTVWVRLSRARRKFLERMRVLEAREEP